MHFDNASYFLLTNLTIEPYLKLRLPVRHWVPPALID